MTYRLQGNLLILLMLHCVCSHAAFCQSAKSADVVDWDSLRDTSGMRQLDIAESTTNAGLLTRRTTVIDSHIEQADRLRTFRSRNTGHAKAKEAMALEALELLYAAYAGDDTQKERRRDLVEQVRSDAALKVEDRASVAAYAENLQVFRDRSLTEIERALAYEAVARGLVAEFPEVPTAYESLWGIAQSLPVERRAEIAVELLDLPAPGHVKDSARTFLDSSESRTPKPSTNVRGKMPNN